MKQGVPTDTTPTGTLIWGFSLSKNVISEFLSVNKAPSVWCFVIVNKTKTTAYYSHILYFSEFHFLISINVTYNNITIYSRLV